MSDYIEREALIETIKNKPTDLKKFIHYNRYDGAAGREIEILNIINSAPAAEVVPVVHGRWIEQKDPMFDNYYTCSVCKDDFYIETTDDTAKDLFLYTYCPSCGAKMDLRGK